MATCPVDPVFPADLDMGLVHDWLPLIGGAERVLGCLASMAPPTTPVYTIFDFLSDQERRNLLGERPVHVSQLNHLPGVKAYYRALLLPCTRAIERFDIGQHDVVISSSAALAKGIIAHPDQLHIAYIHSPARYAWDMSHEYLAGIGGPMAGMKRWLAHHMLHRFRLWDMRCAAGPDLMIANSDFIRRRIARVYRRPAAVIHPPVDVTGFALQAAPRSQAAPFLTASRLVQYKRVDLIISAFNARPDLRLDIIGEGPERARLQRQAGPNIRFLGAVPQADLVARMQAARAFIVAAREDFGLVTLEAQAVGTAVIAPGFGGSAETVRALGASPHPTGVTFAKQHVADLAKAIMVFEKHETAFEPEACRDNALRFSAARFKERMAIAVNTALAQGADAAYKQLSEEAQAQALGDR